MGAAILLRITDGEYVHPWEVGRHGTAHSAIHRRQEPTEVHGERTLLEIESICFPDDGVGNLEFAKMIRHSLPFFGTEVMYAFFRNIRTKAQLLGTKVWPPTDSVPMMYTFFDLISMSRPLPKLPRA